MLEPAKLPLLMSKITTQPRQETRVRGATCGPLDAHSNGVDCLTGDDRKNQRRGMIRIVHDHIRGLQKASGNIVVLPGVGVAVKARKIAAADLQT